MVPDDLVASWGSLNQAIMGFKVNLGFTILGSELIWNGIQCSLGTWHVNAVWKQFLQHIGWHDISASPSANIATQGFILIWSDACREGDGHEDFCHCKEIDRIYLNSSKSGVMTGRWPLRVITFM